MEPKELLNKTTAVSVSDEQLASMTPEESAEFLKNKKGLLPFFIKGDTLFGATKLGNGVCMWWEPNAEKKDDPYLGIMINDPLVAAKLARVFSEFAQHLINEQGKKPGDVVEGDFKGKLQ